MEYRAVVSPLFREICSAVPAALIVSALFYIFIPCTSTRLPLKHRFHTIFRSHRFLFGAYFYHVFGFFSFFFFRLRGIFIDFYFTSVAIAQFCIFFFFKFLFSFHFFILLFISYYYISIIYYTQFVFFVSLILFYDYWSSVWYESIRCQPSIVVRATIVRIVNM